MIDIIARLDELVKRGSKISDGQSKESVSLLLQLYTESSNKAQVADYLMKFKATVCLCFFENAVPTLDLGKIESLHSSICANENYKKNLNHAGTTRGFIIAAVLIKHEQVNARAVLMRTLADVEKDGAFSETVIKNFNKNVVEYCGFNAIEKLKNREWKNPQQEKRFYRFMGAVRDSVITTAAIVCGDSEATVSSSDALTADIEIPPNPLTEADELKIEHSNAEIVPTLSLENDKVKLLTADLMGALEGSVQEAKKLFHTLNESNGTVSILRNQVNERNTRITELNSEIHALKNGEEILRSELEKMQHENSKQNEKITDLTERLKSSMQMDMISQSQELITLKADLANSLKLEYADYLNDSETECNPDTFDALRGSLTRIFRTLRRFGIMID